MTASWLYAQSPEHGQVPVKADAESSLLVSDGLPKYAALVRSGRCFVGNIAAAGVVLPIYSNTTQQLALWNPSGSGIDVMLLRLALTYVDTTGAAGGFTLGYQANAPAAIGTGLAITAFTETAALPCYVNGGNNAAQVAKFGQGATLTVTAPVLYRQLGLNQTVLTAATTGSPQWESRFDFDGDLVLGPGSAIYVGGNIATLSKFTGSLLWAELTR
jgi:hypothetical protein